MTNEKQTLPFQVKKCYDIIHMRTLRKLTKEEHK